MMTGWYAKFACALLVLLSVLASISGYEITESSCNFAAFLSLKSAWAAEDEPCHQKLSFELWILMKADGMAKDAEAQRLRTECMQIRDVRLVEITTAEDWNSDILDAAPGRIVSESKNAKSYLCESVVDLEAFCADEGVISVSRVDVSRALGANTMQKITTSKASRVFQGSLLSAGKVEPELELTRAVGDRETLHVTGNNGPL